MDEIVAWVLVRRHDGHPAGMLTDPPNLPGGTTCDPPAAGRGAPEADRSPERRQCRRVRRILVGAGRILAASSCSRWAPALAAGSSRKAGSWKAATATEPSAVTSSSRWTTAASARAEPTATSRLRLGHRPGEARAGDPEHDEDSHCTSVCQGTLSSRTISEACEQGDALAKRLMRETAHYLAVGAVCLMHTIDPDIVLFGGGMIAAGPRCSTTSVRHPGMRFASPPSERGCSTPNSRRRRFIGAAGAPGRPSEATTRAEPDPPPESIRAFGNPGTFGALAASKWQSDRAPTRFLRMSSCMIVPCGRSGCAVAASGRKAGRLDRGSAQGN